MDKKFTQKSTMTLTFPYRDLVQGYCTPVSTSNLKVKSKQDRVKWRHMNVQKINFMCFHLVNAEFQKRSEILTLNLQKMSFCDRIYINKTIFSFHQKNWQPSCMIRVSDTSFCLEGNHSIFNYENDHQWLNKTSRKKQTKVQIFIWHVRILLT